MALSIQDLTTPKTPDQVRIGIYNQLARIGINTSNWKPGAVVRTIFSVVSSIFSSYTYWATAAVRGVFLLLARGDWLTAKAKYDYYTVRNEATFANGPVTLTNNSASSYYFEPGQLTLSRTVTGIDGSVVTYFYHNTAIVSLGSGTPTPVVLTDVGIKSEVPGLDATIPLGATDLVAVPALTGLTVTVPIAINGSEEESDGNLINRAQLQASSTSPNGPSDAYRYVALSTKRTDGTVIATKCSVRAGNPVQVFVGQPSGAITDSGDLNTLNLAIQTNVVPLGVTATVQSGATKSIAIAYEAWAYKSTTTLSVTEIKAAIAAIVQSFISDFPQGGYPVAEVDGSHAADTYWMYGDSVRSLCEQAVTIKYNGAVPNTVYHVDVTLSVSGITYTDIAFNPGDIAVLTNVDGTVTLV